MTPGKVDGSPNLPSQSPARWTAPAQEDAGAVRLRGPWAYKAATACRVFRTLGEAARRNFLQRDSAARSILLVRSLGRALQYQFRHTTG